MTYQYNDDYDIAQECTKKETDASCPQCAGNVYFDPASGKLSCSYCDWEGEIAIGIDEKVLEQDLRNAEHTGNFQWGAEKKSIICRSCGAQSIYDALQVSDLCPFCNSSQVTQEITASSIAPGGVIPFAVSSDKAIALFHKWINGKFFVPSSLKKNASAQGLLGIYIPFWTFDAIAKATYTAQAGQTYTTGVGRSTQTHIRWFNVNGTYRNFFDDILVNASKRHDSSVLQTVEPFDFKAVKPYKPQFISGFISERYSIGLSDSFNLAKGIINKRLTEIITREIKRRHNASHVRSLRFDTLLSDITYKYVLLPLWMSHYEYQDKKYEFLVNGQTGKVGGKAPASALKIAVVVGSILVVAGGIGTAVVLNDDSSSSNYYSTPVYTQAPAHALSDLIILPNGAVLYF
ncbi:MAG: hypothetical protein FWF37_01160 [Chloroflexi bacterium]|nr:hypothetical protein [Chloroflexota bacterium]